MITSATDGATFNQLVASQDWAGLLELESKMSAIVKTFESSNPIPTAYYKKTAKKAGVTMNEILLKPCLIYLNAM